MNLFRPEPAIVLKTKLPGSVAEFTSWDKVEIQGEISLEELIKQLESKLGGELQRLYPAGNDKVSIYTRSQVKMLDWKIELEGGKATIEPDEVYSTWPQLKMAVQMLGRVPDGPARKNFENQVLSAAKSLQAYVKMLRPSDEEAEKQKYFDAVLQKRSYLSLQADMLTAEGQDADLQIGRAHV